MRWVKMTKSWDDDILHVERRIFEECGRPVNPKRTAHASQAKYNLTHLHTQFYSRSHIRVQHFTEIRMKVLHSSFQLKLFTL